MNTEYTPFCFTGNFQGFFFLIVLSLNYSLKGQFCYFVTYGLWPFIITYWSHISCLLLYKQKDYILLIINFSLSKCTNTDNWYVTNSGGFLQCLKRILNYYVKKFVKESQ